MKKIVYLMISLVVFSILTSAFHFKAIKQQHILIQCNERNVSVAAFNLSTEIITKRLKAYNSDKFEIKPDQGNQQIKIDFPASWNRTTIEKLLTQKGVLAFYETLNHEKVLELVKEDSFLTSSFDGKSAGKAAPIGCFTTTGMEKVKEHLKSLKTDTSCKLCWGSELKDETICLYALKIPEDTFGMLTGNEVKEMSCGFEKEAGSWYISLRFKETVVKTWAEITEHNQGKAIAIVLDDQVLSAPIVNSPITGGNCMITGDFGENQARFVAAIGNNGVLPISFTIIK